MKISIFDKGSNNINISIHINKFKHINTKNLNGFYCHFSRSRLQKKKIGKYIKISNSFKILS